MVNKLWYQFKHCISINCNSDVLNQFRFCLDTLFNCETCTGEVLTQFRKAWESNTDGCLDLIMTEWGQKDLPELNIQEPEVQETLEEEPINENE